jgi:hypothetical protein
MSIFKYFMGNFLTWVKAGAEVVQGDGTAEVDDAPSEGLALGSIAHKSGLGDLEHQVGRVRAGFCHVLVDDGHQVQADDGLGRQVHTDMAPLGGKTDGLFYHPLVDLGDEPVLFRHG